MYADDGIAFTQLNSSPLTRLKISDALIDSSISFSPEKTGYRDKEFKFLGCHFDLETRILTTPTGVKQEIDNMTEQDFLELNKVVSYNGKEGKEWE